MVISDRDRKKATQIIRRLTPQAPLYAKYIRKADKFILHFNQSQTKSSRFSKIHRLEMLTSKYFNKSYLVAFVDRQWFSQIAPTCDAIASSTLTHLDLKSPPIVILPGNSIPNKPGITSIIEHEIVHVNQGIIGKLPSLDSCKLSNAQVFKEITKYTQVEYEANFVQLVHDSTLRPPVEYGFGLEEWCHLRGFTAGLETAIHRMSKAGYPETQLRLFVRKLESDLPAAFKNLGLSKRIGQKFADDIDRMMGIAITNVERGTRGT